jgi:hypothetical protein
MDSIHFGQMVGQKRFLAGFCVGLDTNDAFQYLRK